MTHKRYIQDKITQDIDKKMVFIGGPRQVGKTTLAKNIGQSNFKDSVYLNWDYTEHRDSIIKNRLPRDASLVIFDEIHKYKRWKNYLKGLYDVRGDKSRFLVTGSARLDLYRRGGDSLMGRYFYFRLHPFSLRELIDAPFVATRPFQELTFLPATENNTSLLSKLFNFGGFPEPLFTADYDVLRRFHNDRLNRLVREDIRDIEQLHDLSAMQILVNLLPAKVGSLLSLNALREDLSVAHKTITLWVDILERFYYHYRLQPFSVKQIRSLKREPKMYLWDWTQVEDNGARFENLIASHLLKFTNFLTDVYGYKTELYFLRDRDGREVDFLVTNDRKPWFAVEVKEKNLEISSQLRYFADKLSIPFVFQLVKDSNVDFYKDTFRVISADKFLTALV